MPHQQAQPRQTTNTTNRNYMILLGVNYACLFLGSVSSSLLSKFYFNHKGSSRWVSTWVQSSRFPRLLLPIYLPYYTLKCTDWKPFSQFTPKLLILSIIIGFLLGVNNILFSWGNYYLPVSTSSLLLSSQHNAKQEQKNKIDIPKIIQNKNKKKKKKARVQQNPKKKQSRSNFKQNLNYYNFKQYRDRHQYSYKQKLKVKTRDQTIAILNNIEIKARVNTIISHSTIVKFYYWPLY